MTDSECVQFLQWALPRLRLRWKGLRDFRGQVCKRIGRRMARLGLSEVEAYRARLDADPTEWAVLERLCGVTISRFSRDRGVWEALRDDVLPALARAAAAGGEDVLRCWSIGCASGEEPYTLSIVWALGMAGRHAGLRLQVLATDFDERVLERARAGVYPPGTLREPPATWREQAFEREGELFRLRDEYRAAVELRRADVRQPLPDGMFHLMLCRNLVFTYFDESLQLETWQRLSTKLLEGGAFVVGKHERLPPDVTLASWHPALGIFRRDRRR